MNKYPVLPYFLLRGKKNMNNEIFLVVILSLQKARKSTVMKFKPLNVRAGNERKMFTFHFPINFEI